MADVVVGKRLGIHQMFEQQSLRERAQASRGRRAINRKRSAERAQQFGKKFAPGRADAPVPVPEARMRLRMAQGKELEFQGNQDQPAVLGDFRIVLPQSRKFFERILYACGERQ